MLTAVHRKYNATPTVTVRLCFGQVRTACLALILQELEMPILDHFSSFQPGLSAPATGGFSIVPDDNTDLGVLPRAIMVAAGGDVGAILMDGSTVVLPGLAAGVVYPFRVRRVLGSAGGTTASGIIGLY